MPRRTTRDETCAHVHARTCAHAYASRAIKVMASSTNTSDYAALIRTVESKGERPRHLGPGPGFKAYLNAFRVGSRLRVLIEEALPNPGW